ncbi:hypothetical protein [Caldicellulosiruptor bescii]|uniref:hypothetical protein n=1 Tax=Caldicellulosiruptor bescii TaxID=31899 RepID=UPI0012FCBFE8|nr:hypothetical protein [Caldicellulosiruptor bescii]
MKMYEWVKLNTFKINIPMLRKRIYIKIIITSKINSKVTILFLLIGSKKSREV